MSSRRDTIFAPATGGGRGAIAIIRLSGPAAGPALVALTGRPLPQPRMATRARLRHPISAEPLDDGLALWFPQPHSVTGEDVVELQVHGGRAVTQGLTEALLTMPGLRLAEPGEFTRRAFEHGKLDLTEAEAIADLVNAETLAQRRQALDQLSGTLGRLYEGWRLRLLHVLARLEADIDFPEEDLPLDLTDQAADDLGRLLGEIGRHLEDHHRGERIRDGLAVAIVGPPNAGKSSLLNALARREVAIVSAQSGTTRDVLEVHLDVGGYPVILADTAGLRETTDEVEGEGIRRALARSAAADLKIALFDGARWPDLDGLTAGLVDGATLLVVSKFDRHQDAAPMVAGRAALAVSVQTGDGLPELINRLAALARERLEHSGPPPLTRQRHRAALSDCHAALARALAAPLPELRAEDVRLAARGLGKITGRIHVEDVLDAIFRDFCIGK